MKNKIFFTFLVLMLGISTTKVTAQSDVHHMVTRAALAAGVPTNIAHAVVKMESGYQIKARGAAGEYGLGQVMCPTAREVGFTGNCADLFDPQTNLTYSMRYLKLALDKGGVGCAGVSLYNTGIHRKPICTAYGQRVMAIANSSGK